MTEPTVCSWCNRPGPFSRYPHRGVEWWYHQLPGCCGSWQVDPEAVPEEAGAPEGSGEAGFSKGT